MAKAATSAVSKRNGSGEENMETIGFSVKPESKAKIDRWISELPYEIKFAAAARFFLEAGINAVGPNLTPLYLDKAGNELPLDADGKPIKAEAEDDGQTDLEAAIDAKATAADADAVKADVAKEQATAGDKKGGKAAAKSA